MQVQFDPEGDLLIYVGPTRLEYLVCSRALCRASLRWRRELLEGVLAGPEPQDGQWTMTEAYRKPKPFAILLNIIHTHFSLVPDSLDLEDPYDLLVMVNDWGLENTIKPWSRLWWDHVKNQTNRPLLMWIANGLGKMEAVREVARNIQIMCSVDDEGQLVDDDGVVLCFIIRLQPDNVIGE